jgi:hypothetical protein
MPHQQWLEQVRRAVVRGGLPHEYADRLVTELRDHAEEAGEGSTPLGSPDVIAAAAVHGYRADHWAGRHPVLAQLVAPFLVVYFGWVVYLTVSCWFVEKIGATHDPISLAVAYLLVFASRFVVPLAAVGGLWWVHRRSGRPWWWFTLGGAVVALLAAAYTIRFIPPAEAFDHEPELIVDFSLLDYSWWSFAQAGVVAAAVSVVATVRRPRFA